MDISQCSDRAVDPDHTGTGIALGEQPLFWREAAARIENGSWCQPHKIQSRCHAAGNFATENPQRSPDENRAVIGSPDSPGIQ